MGAGEIKVSVIIPIFNAERFLRECLDSVLAQTLREIEVICVDDCSTDGTAGILEEFSKSDKRVKVITQSTNQFAGVARNSGIEKARGKYLVFWDSDDFFESNALEHMYNQCERDNADMCVCHGRGYDVVTGKLFLQNHFLNLEYLPEEVPFSSKNYPKHAFQLCNPAPWNKMFLKSFVEKEGLEFQALQRGNDLYFVFMALATAERVTVIDRILINHRRRTSTSLQETNAGSPFCFYEALLALQQGLAERGMFELFQESFVTLSLGNCIYNLNAAKTKEAWLVLALRLKDEIFLKLGCNQYPKEFFPGSLQYEQMEFLLSSTKQELEQWQPVLRCDEETENGKIAEKWAEPDDPLKVSVIIPVFNVEDYVEECVRSVMEQTLRGVEIICVDDGSQDGSSAIIERLQKEDDRIKIFRQKNSGLSVTRNNGLKHANGEYVVFLDSDDFLARPALESLYRECKDNNLDELFFSGVSFYEPVELFAEQSKLRYYYIYKESYDAALNGRELFVQLMENRDFKPSAALQMLSREFLLKNEIGFYPGIYHEDNLFTLHCLMLAERVKVLNEPLYMRRVRPDSITTVDKNWKHIYGYLVCIREIKKNLSKFNLDDMLFWQTVVAYQATMGRSAYTTLWKFSEEEILPEVMKLPQEERAEILLLLEFIRDNGRWRSGNISKGRKLGELQGRYTSAKKLIRQEQKNYKALKEVEEELRYSFYFRFGRFVTAPIWAIGRLFKKRKK